MKEEFFEPVYDGKDEIKYYRWDSDSWFNSLPPYEQRNITRKEKVWGLSSDLYKHIPWMSWPILKVVYTFWRGIFEEGVISTIKPRWGTMTFAYLNDGAKPTLWHTWRQMTRSSDDAYTGIYPRGAPKSLKQAMEWEEEWEAKRWEGYKAEEDE